MAETATQTSRGRNETWLRVGCGSVSLALSLLCIVASFRGALTMEGTEALTLGGFFAWGAALAYASVWLIRGRSKGKPLVLVRTRRRLILFAVFVLLVVGCIGLLVILLPTEDDPWWPLIAQTMFAVLIASLPLLLFDREGYEEQEKPAQLNPRQRRLWRRRVYLLLAGGVLMTAGGITADVQVETWWSEALYRIGLLLLGIAVVLGYQLRKSVRSSEPDMSADDQRRSDVSSDEDPGTTSG